MPQKRDLVNFESEERVDLGDMVAVQRNSRSDVRKTIEGLLFANNISERQRVIGGFRLTQSSPPDQFLNVADGVAVGSELLPDVTLECGVVYGDDTVLTRALDFSAKAVGVHKVWVRFSSDPGEPGVRVFFNADTGVEEGDTINTKIVFDWDVEIATVSPGDEYILLGEVDWDGAAVVSADITHLAHLFFEGDPATDFAHEWGDGGDDRSDNRSSSGIRSGLYQWVHAVRRQISDIIGVDDAWYSAIPLSLQGVVTAFTGLVPVTGLNPGTLFGLENTTIKDDGLINPVDRVKWVTAVEIANSFGEGDILGIDPSDNGIQLVETYGSGNKVACKLYSNASAATFTTYLPLEVEGSFPGSPAPAFTKMVVFGHRILGGGATPATVVVSLVEHNPVTGAKSFLSIVTIADGAAGDFTAGGTIANATDTRSKVYFLKFEWQCSSDITRHIGLYGIKMAYRMNKLRSWKTDDTTPDS